MTFRLSSAIESQLPKFNDDLLKINHVVSSLIQLHVISISKTYQDDDLLSIDEFADYVGIKSNTLRKMRCCDVDLPPQLGSGKLIRYRKRNIDAWLERNARIQAKEDK